MIEAISSPTVINFPPMPQIPNPPTSFTNDMSDTMIWSMNLGRNLRKLTPKKRTRLMENIEDDVRASLVSQRAD